MLTASGSPNLTHGKVSRVLSHFRGQLSEGKKPLVLSTQSHTAQLLQWLMNRKQTFAGNAPMTASGPGCVKTRFVLMLALKRWSRQSGMRPRRREIGPICVWGPQSCIRD